MSPITVYTKPACVQCTAAFRALDKAGISYETIDVTQNADAREFVISLGYLFSLGFATVSLQELGLVGAPDAGGALRRVRSPPWLCLRIREPFDREIRSHCIQHASCEALQK
jgi:glutaredoxin